MMDLGENLPFERSWSILSYLASLMLEEIMVVAFRPSSSQSLYLKFCLDPLLHFHPSVD